MRGLGGPICFISYVVFAIRDEPSGRNGPLAQGNRGAASSRASKVLLDGPRLCMG